MNKPHPTGDSKTTRAEKTAIEKAQLKAEYLRWYEQGGAMYWAAAKINRSVDAIADWRREDPAFDQAVMTAYQRSTDALKMTAFMRAMKGQSKGSDNLMMFLIKQRDPSYRDSFGIDARHLHTGSVGQPAKVPPAVQAACDAVALDLVKKMAEQL